MSKIVPFLTPYCVVTIRNDLRCSSFRLYMCLSVYLSLRNWHFLPKRAEKQRNTFCNNCFSKIIQSEKLIAPLPPELPNSGNILQWSDSQNQTQSQSLWHYSEDGNVPSIRIQITITISISISISIERTFRSSDSEIPRHQSLSELNRKSETV
jgi:hypothetical protein